MVNTQQLDVEPECKKKFFSAAANVFSHHKLTLSEDHDVALKQTESNAVSFCFFFGIENS